MSAAIEAIFAETGGAAIDPPTLMPAAVPLELSGEAVRARLCVFTDDSGHEQAMRPDLTLPVAGAEAARRTNGGDGEQAYTYNARAYRLPSAPGQPLEFQQIGAEQFGGPSTPEADAALFDLVVRAGKAGGAETGSIWLGDLAIVPAFIDALSLSETQASALKRAFRQAGGLSALLSERSERSANGLAEQLTGATRDEIAIVARSVLASSGGAIGLRTEQEIIDGLVAKAAALSEGGITAGTRNVLQQVLTVETAPDATADALSALATSAGLSGADPAIERLATRMDALNSLAPDMMKRARFGTPFGRRFNYYDGFVFELFAPGAAPSDPYGAGGRYDTLIARLSDGAASATGIGGVIRPDRLAGESA